MYQKTVARVGDTILRLEKQLNKKRVNDNTTAKKINESRRRTLGK
jgi:hypothetical protein